MKNKKEEKLIRIDFTIKYSVVGLNVYNSNDLNKLAKEILLVNRGDIFQEAFDYGSAAKIEIIGTEIKTRKDLPEGYSKGCLPWLSVVYGNNESYTIGHYLK